MRVELLFGNTKTLSFDFDNRRFVNVRFDDFRVALPRTSAGFFTAGFAFNRLGSAAD
jgi:hypothetical protein